MLHILETHPELVPFEGDLKLRMERLSSKKKQILEEGKTLKEVAMFVTSKLSTLDAITGTSTHFVLKKYKDYGIIMMDKPKSNRMKVTL